jgi:hypothetical protein
MEFVVTITRTRTAVNEVTVVASSEDEAKERALDWMNNGQDWSDSDEFIIDHDDCAGSSAALDDTEWIADSATHTNKGN